LLTGARLSRLRRLVGNAFELTDLGEQDLKGIAEPVHAWRVERALVTESRFDASHGVGAMTPLIGREEELDLLLADGHRRRTAKARWCCYQVSQGSERAGFSHLACRAGGVLGSKRWRTARLGAIGGKARTQPRERPRESMENAAAG
jgi:hypothetical protein